VIVALPLHDPKHDTSVLFRKVLTGEGPATKALLVPITLERLSINMKLYAVPHGQTPPTVAVLVKAGIEGNTHELEALFAITVYGGVPPLAVKPTTALHVPGHVALLKTATVNWASHVKTIARKTRQNNFFIILLLQFFACELYRFPT
jgi:hypothetical protein